MPQKSDREITAHLQSGRPKFGRFYYRNKMKWMIKRVTVSYRKLNYPHQRSTMLKGFLKSLLHFKAQTSVVPYGLGHTRKSSNGVTRLSV